MNKKNLLSIAAFAVLGLIVGYAYFGKWAGDYVSLKTLFSFGGNAFQNAFRSASGIEEMRNNILLSGVVGAVVGVLLTFKLKK
jgi:ABC-type Co2+ transport system permease subunit